LAANSTVVQDQEMRVEILLACHSAEMDRKTDFLDDQFPVCR
jgi:hypothetical protein